MSSYTYSPPQGPIVSLPNDLKARILPITQGETIRTKKRALELVEQILPPLKRPHRYALVEEDFMYAYRIIDLVIAVLEYALWKRKAFRIYQKPAYHFSRNLVHRLVDQVVEIKNASLLRYDSEQRAKRHLLEKEKEAAAHIVETGSHI